MLTFYHAKLHPEMIYGRRWGMLLKNVSIVTMRSDNGNFRFLASTFTLFDINLSPFCPAKPISGLHKKGSTFTKYLPVFASKPVIKVDVLC